MQHFIRRTLIRSLRSLRSLKILRSGLMPLVHLNDVMVESDDTQSAGESAPSAADQRASAQASAGAQASASEAAPSANARAGEAAPGGAAPGAPEQNPDAVRMFDEPHYQTFLIKLN